MITITIRRDEMSAQLIVSGHARYAQKGQDIVCAAVSTVTNLLANLAESWRDIGLRNLVSADDDDGGPWHIFIDCGGNPVVSAALDCIIDTYQQIAVQYPQNATVKMID